MNALIEDEVSDALEFSGSDEGTKNTDAEIWRKVPDDYYSPSIHVTEQGDIGINVGGYVLVSPIERWFAAGEAANRRGCLIEDDYNVRMPPLREYPVRVRIKSVTKGTPRFVGMEDECYGCRYGSCDTCPPNLWWKDEIRDVMGICEWDELSDEVLEGFERLVDQSAPPEIVWCRQRPWTENDWIDWLKGDEG